MKYQVKDTGKQDGWAHTRLWLSVLISLNGKQKSTKEKDLLIHSEQPKHTSKHGSRDPIKLLCLKEMGIPDHLTYLLRNLYAGQEATVRTGLGTTD